jgi:hypothetical protein
MFLFPFADEELREPQPAERGACSSAIGFAIWIRFENFFTFPGFHGEPERFSWNGRGN